MSRDDVAVRCQGVEKRFYYFEHRTTTLREAFVRSLLRRPLTLGRSAFSLRGLSLDVRRGEAVVLLGPNGSGKSTVLRLLAGIYAPSEGRIEVNGRVAAVIELGAGFHTELSGAENVALYGTILGMRRSSLASRLDDIVAFAGLQEFIDVPVKYYSSGMVARLAFATTVSLEPDVLLLDEVLAVGDQDFRERCLDRLAAFHRAGGTLITVSHDLNTAARLCTRAVWLEQGAVRMDGPFAEVRRAYEGHR
jgi:ABC-type polysaccharide/polyol phosphate transport system ATPase subunit